MDISKNLLLGAVIGSSIGAGLLSYSIGRLHEKSLGTPVSVHRKERVPLLAPTASAIGEMPLEEPFRGVEDFVIQGKTKYDFTTLRTAYNMAYDNSDPRDIRTFPEISGVLLEDGDILAPEGRFDFKNSHDYPRYELILPENK